MKYKYEIRKAQLSHKTGCLSAACRSDTCYGYQKLEVWKMRAACCHCGAIPHADSVRLATFDNTPQGSIHADQYLEFLKSQPEPAVE